MCVKIAKNIEEGHNDEMSNISSSEIYLTLNGKIKSLKEKRQYFTLTYVKSDTLLVGQEM